MYYHGINYRDPQPFHKVLEIALMENPMNQVTSMLERDHKAREAITRHITRELGQERVVNLAPTYDRSRIALATYAGDGIVVKVIPANYCDKLGNVPFLLPSISRQYFPGDMGGYVVKTYPWLPPSHAAPKAIEAMRQRIAEYGLRFIDGDDKPNNIHVLPDGKGTLVGIDSDMYYTISNRQVDPLQVARWMAYVGNIFPIYEIGEIPRQTESTSFDFVSLARTGREETRKHDDREQKPGTAVENLLTWVTNFIFGKGRRG